MRLAVAATATSDDQFRALAASLSFGEPLDPTRADARLVAELREGRVVSQGHHIAFDQWEYPPGMPPAQLGHWHFVYHSLGWLDPLRRRWLATGEASLLDAERALIERRLAEFGPPPAERSSFPVHGFAWADMASAWRTMVLIGFASAVGREPWLVAALETHLDGLLDPRGYGGLGNHALHHCNALASVALLLDRPDALAVAQQRLAKLREESFDDQGVSLEGSAAYHLLNLSWWRDTVRRGAVIGVHGGAPLAAIPDGRAFLQDLIADDGRFVPIGDSVIQSRAAASWLRARFGEEEADRLLAPLPEQDDPGRVGQGAAGRLAVYDDGFGFSRRIDRSGERSFVTLRFGRGSLLRPHAHEDAGAVTFYAGGDRWLEDGGAFGYRGGAFRKFCRSQAAHSGVVAPRVKYLRDVASTLLDARFEDDGNHVAVEIAALRDSQWRRSLGHFGEPASLLVHDVVRAGRGDSVYSVWNLATDAEIASWTDERIDIMLGEARAVLVFAGDAAANEHHFGSEDPLRGWRCVSRTLAVPIHSVWRRVDAREAIMAAAIIALPPSIGFEDVEIESFDVDRDGASLTLRLGDRRFERRVTTKPGAGASRRPASSG